MQRFVSTLISGVFVFAAATPVAASDEPAGIRDAYVSVEQVLEPDETGVARPARLAWDAQAGQLLASDDSDRGATVGVTPTGARRGLASSARLHALRAASDAAARRLDLASIGADPSTVAIDAATGHVFAYAPASSTIWEMSATGDPLSRRDVSDAGLTSVASMTVAPSADTSDAPAEMALFVADSGAPDGSGAAIVELALVEPVLDTVAISAATSSVSLVRTIATGQGSTWNPDSPDPSGLAYIPLGAAVPASMQDRLVSADGEVEETTGAGWNNVNVWFAPRDGSAQTATMNTVQNANPSNNEPVGAAYDSTRNELYLCKDGSNGRIWVYDMSGPTPVQVRSFTVTGAPYNNADVEGLAFDSARNILYMVDAIDNDLVKVTKNGVIGTGGETVANYDLQQYGQSEPEGLDVDPATGNIWVVSNKVSGGGTPDPMIEVTPTGSLVSSVSIAAANPHSAGGLAMAPPSGVGLGHNIYVADRGVDNNDVPTENDGRIYEFSRSAGGGSAPVASFTSQQQPGTFTVSFTDTSTNGPTSWSWNFGDPTSSSNTSTEQNPTHTYPVALSYQVTLTVTNDFGTDSETKTVTVTDGAPPPPPSSNLLSNGGFESADGSGRPTSWRVVSGFSRSNAIQPREGSYVGQHTSTANASWNVYQQVPVTAGQRYAFSGDVNIPTTSDAFKFQIRVQWRGSSNTTVTLRKFTDDTGGAWETVTSSSLAAPAGATAARIQMVPSSLNGMIYVDAFTFSASP